MTENESELVMECEDEELTPYQVEYYQTAGVEDSEIRETIPPPGGTLCTYNVVNNRVKLTSVDYSLTSKAPKNTPSASALPTTSPSDETTTIIDVNQYYGSMDGDPLYQPKPSEPPYLCCKCGHVCKGNIGLMLHLDSHLQETRKANLDKGLWVYCEHCTLQFNSPATMMHHVTKHHGGPNMCRICELGFESQRALHFHLQDTHPPLQMPYSCPLCMFRCSIREKLMGHFGTQHNQEPYLLCPYCLLLFHTSQTFMLHLHKHQDKQDCHQCKLCQLAFLTPSRLWVHTSMQHKSWVPPKPSRQEKKEAAAHKRKATTARKQKATTTAHKRKATKARKQKATTASKQEANTVVLYPADSWNAASTATPPPRPSVAAASTAPLPPRPSVPVASTTPPPPRPTVPAASTAPPLLSPIPVALTVPLPLSSVPVTVTVPPPPRPSAPAASMALPPRPSTPAASTPPAAASSLQLPSSSKPTQGEQPSGPIPMTVIRWNSAPSLPSSTGPPRPSVAASTQPSSLAPPTAGGEAGPQGKRASVKGKPKDWWKDSDRVFTCCECGSKVAGTRLTYHFKPKPLGCPKCPYLTYCPSSFPNHVIDFHFAPALQEFSALPLVSKVKKPAASGGGQHTVLTCQQCGCYETTHASSMAAHVDMCPRRNIKNKEKFKIHPWEYVN